MRKERLALVEGVSDQLHTLEDAMHVVMTEYAKLGLVMLDARAEARLSPLIGGDVLSSHADGQKALARFMICVEQTHTGLRDLGRVMMPGVAIGDTPTRPTGYDASEGPRLVSAA